MTLFWKLLRKRLVPVLAAVGANGLHTAVMLWWNAQLGGIINTVSEGRPIPADSAVLAMATALCLGVVAYGSQYISGIACESMTHDLRVGYARHFAGLPFAESERLNAGEQLSRLQNEIADVSGYLNANLFQLVGDGVRFIMTFIWLLFLNPTLTLIITLPVFAIMVYVAYASKIISAATSRSQQAKGRMNGYADTLLSLFPLIRLYDAARMILTAYGGHVDAWEEQTVRLERTKARLMSLSAFLSGIPLLLLFLAGGGMVIRGALAVGTLYIFLNLLGNVSGVMMNIPGYIAAFRQFTVNMRRLDPYVSLEGRSQCRS